MPIGTSDRTPPRRSTLASLHGPMGQGGPIGPQRRDHGIATTHLQVRPDRAPRGLDPHPSAERDEIGRREAGLEGLTEIGDEAIVEVREDLRAPR